MNIIPQTTAYQLQERHTSAIGVEYIAVTDPAGNDREQAHKLFTERVAETEAPKQGSDDDPGTENEPAFRPHTGIRLVLLGGDR